MSKHKARKSSARQRQKREQRRSQSSHAIEYQLSRVLELLEDDELEKARDRLRELSQRHPGNADVLGLLANTCQDLGEKQEALEACQRLARVTPDDPDVHLMLAGLALECTR